MAELFGISTIWIIWIIFGLFFLIFLAMAPCHAIFLFPFLGLPLFWLLPLGYALPINLIIWVATPFLIRVIRKAMKKVPADGFRSLVGTHAEVVSRQEEVRSARYLVRAQGELWTTYSTNNLENGEQVKIVGTRGIGLVVERTTNGSVPGKIGDARTIASGGKTH